VAGGVNDVDCGALIPNGSVFGENCDALLALEVTGVHDAIGNFLVGPECPGLTQHGVDQCGLSVVDVSDDCDIAQIILAGHNHTTLVGVASTSDYAAALVCCRN
jgi:hypothetical protein